MASKIDELRSHPAFPGGLVSILQEFEGRIAAIEAHKPMLDALKPGFDKDQAARKAQDQQSTTGVVDNS